MATNNRIVDYNLHNIKTQDTVFQTFLTNIQSSANSYNLEALKECYTKLPIEWRNSDKVFVAGAWNVGNILGYDRNGGLVSMPFSRASVGYANRDFEMYSCAIDEPIIDQISFGRQYGIIMEDVRPDRHCNTSLSGTSGVSATLTNATSYVKGGWTKITEVHDYNYGNNPAYNLGRMYLNIGGTTFPSWHQPAVYAKYFKFYVDVTNSRSNQCIQYGVSASYYVIVDMDGNVISNTSSFIHLVKFTKFKLNGNTYIEIIGNMIHSELSFNMFGLVLHPLNVGYIGDSSFHTKLGWLYYGATLEDLENSYLYRGVINNTSAVQNVKQEDMITINLTQTSDIFINTSKGAFTFRNQPAGTFDYKSAGIINCKLYNIAIKHA